MPLLYRGDTHLGLRPAGVRGPLWRLKTRALLHRYAAYLAVGQRARALSASPTACRRPASMRRRTPSTTSSSLNAAAPHLTEAGREARRAARTALRPDDFVVLFAGKLLRQKQAPDDALRAVAKLGPSAALLVVGDGERADAARAEAARLGVHVTWAGFLNQHADWRAPMRRPIASSCRARAESWGLVVNEAMATGLPAVVSDAVGCAPDLIVPGETGETFRRDNVDDLAEALARVRERGGRSGMGQACLARIDQSQFRAGGRGPGRRLSVGGEAAPCATRDRLLRRDGRRVWDGAHDLRGLAGPS